MTQNDSVTLLLVEDDVGHARLIEKNLQRSHVSNKIIVLDNGQKALDFLFRDGIYEGTEALGPLLVLLDLDLPLVDGYQVLKRMKEDEQTKHIPVIILTAADDPQTEAECYSLGANVFITKPVDSKNFSEAISKLNLFLEVVQIPPRELNFVVLNGE